MRIYRFLFTKFKRVWFVGGLRGEVLLLWEGRVYSLQISPCHIILSVNSDVSFLSHSFFLPFLPFLLLGR